MKILNILKFCIDCHGITHGCSRVKVLGFGCDLNENPSEENATNMEFVMKIV
jgi:hypothetical protein